MSDQDKIKRLEARVEELKGFLAHLRQVNESLKEALDGDTSAAIAGALADGEAYGRSCERGRANRTYLDVVEAACNAAIEAEGQPLGLAELEAAVKPIWEAVGKLDHRVIATPLENVTVPEVSGGPDDGYQARDELLAEAGAVLVGPETEPMEDEDADPVDVEKYISGLPMDSLSDRERTLVAGNIRGFAMEVRQACKDNGPGNLEPCPECGRSCTCS